MRRPFFRKQTQCWYVWQGKRCVKLAKDKDEAERLWHQMQIRSAPVKPDATVQTVIDLFLEWCQKNRGASTFDWYERYCNRFAKHLGHLTVEALKPHHVEDWLAEQYGHCSDNGQNGAVRAVTRAFNWAVKRGQLDRNPIVGVERPQAQPRETYLQPEDWQRLIESVKGSLKDILTILRETGCRPHEARTVEARHVDRSTRSWVFEVSESKGKRSKRIVPLNDRAWELTQRLMLKYPTGPLFRNSREKPWTTTSLCHRVKTVGRKLGINITPYTLRHTYVTNAIANGVDPVTTASIVGHKDLTMIMRVYQHVQLRARAIARQAA